MAFIVFQQIVALFFVVFVGYSLTKMKLFTEAFIKGLGAYLVKAAIPVTLLANFQQPFSKELLEQLQLLSLGMLISIAGTMLLCLPLCLLLGITKKEAGVWITTAAFSNAIFMGAPIYQSVYGYEAGFPLSAVILSFTFLMYSLAMPLISAFSGQNRLSFLDIVKMLARNPGIIASVVGLLIFMFSITIPAPLMGGFRLIGNTLTPCAMLIVGYSLAQMHFKDVFNDYRVYVISAVKLIASPLLTFYTFRLFIDSPVILGILSIGAAMPTATTLASFCQQFDNNFDLSSKVIFASTLMSLVTAPLVILLMQGYI